MDQQTRLTDDQANYGFRIGTERHNSGHHHKEEGIKRHKGERIEGEEGACGRELVDQGLRIPYFRI
jgi:hypothetical protein